MEEFIQILIFVGAMIITVVGQNAKGKKKPNTTSPQEVLEEMFPDMEVAQEMPVAEQPPKSQPRPIAKRKPHMSSIQSQVSQASVPPTPQEKQKISLSNRKEARRAFIYSEIFNRKY